MSLKFDPDLATTTLCNADKRIARLVERAGPFTMRPQKANSPFDMLLRAIVNQQLSGKAAATILARVHALFPDSKRAQPQDILSVKEKALREAGLSWAKVASVRDLAARTLDGTVPSLARLHKMDDAEIVSRLVQVRGIGVWSVEMLLIFRLGRPDVLPVADLGVRKGFMLTYRTKEMPTIKELAARGERWRPYRSVASWYLWRAVDLAKNGENAWA